MMGEDLPQHANRVDLDPSVKDVYGRAALRITYARHAHDEEMIAHYFPKLTEIARARAPAGHAGGHDQAARGAGLQASPRNTRMGTDPGSSVCDPWGRLHDVENVWVADGGLFPTSTAFNPTLTQQALAWRTAAYMVNPEDPRHEHRAPAPLPAAAVVAGLILGLAACADDTPAHEATEVGVPTPGIGQHAEANAACLACHTPIAPRWALPSSHGALLDCTHCHGTFGRRARPLRLAGVRRLPQPGDAPRHRRVHHLS